MMKKKFDMWEIICGSISIKATLHLGSKKSVMAFILLIFNSITIFISLVNVSHINKLPSINQFILQDFDLWILTDMTCPKLSAENGEVIHSKQETKETAVYKCDAGYQISGSMERTCEDGSWSGEEPVCSPCKILFIIDSSKLMNNYFYAPISL